MAVPSIGSLGPVLPGGRQGVVVGAQPVGEARDGRQLVALKIKSVADRTGTGHESAAPSRSQMAPPERPVLARPADPPLLHLDRGQVGPPPAARGYDELSQGEKHAVDRLRQRDAQVRQEETNHAAVAGDLAGPINYIYQRGPDGRLYAVGGSVPIQGQTLSGDPEAAERLGARVAAAAHAATNPSAADLAAARSGYALQSRAEQQSNAAGRRLDLFA